MASGQPPSGPDLWNACAEAQDSPPVPPPSEAKPIISIACQEDAQSSHMSYQRQSNAHDDGPCLATAHKALHFHVERSIDAITEHLLAFQREALRHLEGQIEMAVNAGPAVDERLGGTHWPERELTAPHPAAWRGSVHSMQSMQANADPDTKRGGGPMNDDLSDQDEQDVAISKRLIGYLRKSSDGQMDSTGTHRQYPVLGGSSDNMRKTAMFADVDDMKAKVRAAVAKKDNDLSTLYSKSGFIAAIARSTIFDNFSLVLVMSNALWIAIEVDNNKSPMLMDAEPVYQICEHVFTLLFLVEWSVRFGAFESKRNMRKDMWFLFDSALCLMMVGETWVLNIVILLGLGGQPGGGNRSSMSLLRIFRLCRMARMARLFRMLPELLILVKGIAVAARSVFFTLCLLSSIVYVFAIVFRQLTDGTALAQEYFTSVPHAMSSLLLHGVLPDLAAFMTAVATEHWALGAILLIFTLFASLTVMNMLVGVIVEVVSVVAKVENEELRVTFVKGRLQELLQKNGVDIEIGFISKEVLQNILIDTDAAKAIQGVGVDVVGLIDTADYLFGDTDGVSFNRFMDLMLSLRGSNTATVKDIVDLRKLMLQNLKATEERIAEGFIKLNELNSSRSMSSSRGLQPRRRPSQQSGRAEGNSPRTSSGRRHGQAASGPSRAMPVEESLAIADGDIKGGIGADTPGPGLVPPAAATSGLRHVAAESSSKGADETKAVGDDGGGGSYCFGAVHQDGAGAFGQAVPAHDGSDALAEDCVPGATSGSTGSSEGGTGAPMPSSDNRGGAGAGASLLPAAVLPSVPGFQGHTPEPSHSSKGDVGSSMSAPVTHAAVPAPTKLGILLEDPEDSNASPAISCPASALSAFATQL